MSVAQGARLGGIGTVGAVTSSGTIAPGKSIGTLTIAGNLQLSSSSTYEVDVEPQGTSDKLAVQGSAKLAGAVAVKPATGEYKKGVRYTILAAGGGLGGTTFESLSVTSPGLSAELSYDPNNAFLTVFDKSSRQFSGIVKNDNEQALASVLDALGDSNNVPTSLQGAVDKLKALSAEDQAKALEEIAPEEHATEETSKVSSSNQVQRILTSEVHAQHNGSSSVQTESPVAAAGPVGRAAISAASGSIIPPDRTRADNKKKNEVWALGFELGGDVDPAAGAAQATFHGGGVALGRGWRVSDQLTLGALAAYSDTRIDTGAGASRTDVEGGEVGAYASWSHGAWYADGLLARSFSDHQSRRVISIPGLASVANGKRDGKATIAFVETGRSYPVRDIKIVPHSTLQFGHFTENAFTETGAGALNMSVAGNRVDSVQTGLGIRIEEQAKGNLAPQLTLRWAHELGSLQRNVDASFVGTTQTFRVSGRAAPRDALQIQASAVGRIGHGPDLELAYVGEEASGQATHGGFARAVWHW